MKNKGELIFEHKPTQVRVYRDYKKDDFYYVIYRKDKKVYADNLFKSDGRDCMCFMLNAIMRLDLNYKTANALFHNWATFLIEREVL